MSKNLSECHAYIFHFTKCSNTTIDKLAIGVPYQDKTNIGVGNQQNVTRAIVETQGLFLIKRIRRFDDRPHPSPIPTILPEMCIKLRGNVKLVVDPFVGIGSSAVASMNLNKSFIRFEIDNFYLDITAKRLETLS